MRAVRHSQDDYVDDLKTARMSVKDPWFVKGVVGARAFNTGATFDISMIQHM